MKMKGNLNETLGKFGLSSSENTSGLEELIRKHEEQEEANSEETAKKISGGKELRALVEDATVKSSEFQEALLKLLLKYYPTKIIDECDPHTLKTALHLAAEQRDVEKMGALLDAGANPKLQAIGRKDAHAFLREKQVTERQPVKINKKKGTLGNFQDPRAMAENAILVRFLSSPSKPKAISANDLYILAVRSNKSEGELRTAILQLISEKCLEIIIDAPDPKSKKTALHWAAGAGNIKKIQILLDAGADPLLKDGNHETPLDLLEKFLKNNPGSAEKLPPNLKDRLRQKGKNIYLSSSELLQENKGFPLESKEKATDQSAGNLSQEKSVSSGEDLRQLAAEPSESGLTSIQIFLEKRDPKRLILINEKDPISGKTALHCAAEKGNVKVMEALIMAGAKPGLQDNEHKIAWDYFQDFFERNVKAKKVSVLNNLSVASIEAMINLQKTVLGLVCDQNLANQQEPIDRIFHLWEIHLSLHYYYRQLLLKNESSLGVNIKREMFSDAGMAMVCSESITPKDEYFLRNVFEIRFSRILYRESLLKFNLTEISEDKFYMGSLAGPNAITKDMEDFFTFYKDCLQRMPFAESRVFIEKLSEILNTVEAFMKAQNESKKSQSDPQENLLLFKIKSLREDLGTLLPTTVSTCSSPSPQTPGRNSFLETLQKEGGNKANDRSLGMNGVS